MTRQSKQHGLTIIEIMVAIAISMILLTGVIQLFVTSKKTYRTAEELSRLQENGRFAMEFILRDIRRAGFQGCRSRREIPSNNIADPAPPADLYDANAAIGGSDNDNDDTNDAINGTDIVSIQFGGTCGGTLTGNMDADNAQIHITAPNTCNLEKDGYFMISDCQSADIARVSSNPCDATPGVGGCPSGKQNVAHANNVNISNRLSKAYQGDAEIFALESRSYYIDTNANGNLGLYRENFASGNKEELVEGIENMQILYGEDTTGDRVPNRYVPAHNVTDMEDVVSVKVSLLAYTIEDRVAENNQTYNYDINDNNSVPDPGSTHTAADKRIRRAFTATVSLRNRLK